ncbi:hypothetical protein ElyMa_004496000 [Elysia marginata]|uniref:Uncharacterized protein n=1 Tax=Elysia marginata TaxID=1093978 RepID=A0AAV4HJ75_9GAST|nr:hypothetical protein ElyMa_004496000 [Elysia marginata]
MGPAYMNIKYGLLHKKDHLMLNEEGADPDFTVTTGNQLYTNIKLPKLVQDRVAWRGVASRPQNGPQQPESVGLMDCGRKKTKTSS